MKKIQKIKLLQFKESLSRLLFYGLVFILPANLGLHFIYNEAYIRGLLVDYLVPAIYVQDIIIIFLLVLNFKAVFKQALKMNKFLVWFIFAVFLSSFNKEFLQISLFNFFKLCLYIGLMLYVKADFDYRKHFKEVVGIISLTVLVLSVLAFFQWRGQGSVFDNYLFFGEQPYSIATPGINIENFFGVSRVPPYGTFRHPNVFGGFLSITLLWILARAKDSRFLKLVFLAGLLTLFFTLSKLAWISFLLGLLILVNKGVGVRKARAVFWLIIILFITSFNLSFVPNIGNIHDNPSYYRRTALQEASYKLTKLRPLFGVGYGTSTAYTGSFAPLDRDLRFAQPPHSIFVLSLVESGIFAFFTFLIFFVKSIKQSQKKTLLLIALLQIMFLGSYDHYFFTMQQTQILFWLLIGFI